MISTQYSADNRQGVFALISIYLVKILFSYKRLTKSFLVLPSVMNFRFFCMKIHQCGGCPLGDLVPCLVIHYVWPLHLGGWLKCLETVSQVLRVALFL